MILDQTRSTVDSTSGDQTLRTESSDAPINTPEDNLNKLFVDLGGAGRFQYLAYAVIGLALNSTGYWAYPLGYFIQQPNYSCQFAQGISQKDRVEICTAVNICSNDARITSWSIDSESEKTLENWQGKLDLMCAP